ncbi:MAG: glycosyltransferase family 4 protein [Lachnospiraceae bacterium]|nr:glycosyltransferase family 4 protein [Lachnospiraceae bacterium]
MRIVHICLCDPYAENWSYHRNILSEQNAKDGHDTYIITTEYAMDINGKHGEKGRQEYTNKYGVHIIRLKYKYWLPKAINGKINTVRGLRKQLFKIRPDIIMVHNQQTFNLNDIGKYKKKNPNIILLADSHASFANSCRTAFSRWIVQGIFFKKVICSNFNYIDGMYYIGEEELKFFRTVYGIREDKNSILPLPARFIERKEKERNILAVRSELNLVEDELLFVHSGKLTIEKKTIDILQCLKEFKNKKFKLLIIGSIPNDREDLKREIESDKRFVYMGWKTSEELMRYVSAADLYIQPGSVSVTMNNSLAVGTPVMVYKHKAYERYFGGWEILVNNKADMIIQFSKIFENSEELKTKVKFAYDTAHKYFDCRIFANEMYDYVRGKKEGGPIISYINGIRYVSQ